MGIFKIIFRIILVLIVLVVVLMAVTQIVPDKPPKDFLVVKNPLNLSEIYSFSRMRSCQGHRSMPQFTNEPNSSMAHYVFGKWDENKKPVTMEIFAPFDGYVTNVLEIDGFAVLPKSSLFPWWPFNQWRLNIDHGKTLPQFNGIAVPIKAGELIGYGEESIDFRLAVIALPPDFKDGNGEPYKKMDSIFRYMDDNVFAEYKSAIPAIQNPDDFVIPVSYRISNPCQYMQNNMPYFMSSDADYLNEKYGDQIFVGIENTPDNILKKRDCFLQKWGEQRNMPPNCGSQ